MKPAAITGFCALLAGSAVQAMYNCPVMPSSSDAAVIEFGLAVQTLLSNYYQSVPVNQTFFSTLPQNTVSPTDFLANIEGLARQAVLGVQALQSLAAAVPSAKAPTCRYTLPPVTDAMSHLQNAYQIEATLCGTFIGLADYVQSPQAAFLMARMAAEHGIHASYIGSHMKPQVFMANSTSLTPAFTPSHVLMSGQGVGYLGQYLDGCASAPAAPCGGNVMIGDLVAQLLNQGYNSTGGGYSPTTTGGYYAPSAITTGPAVFTGAAQNNRRGIAGGIGGVALVVAMML
ncbi:hypothetical protein LTS18_003262 [Coniosporium uncinatum]|uniref:Uncharacterized protein n=1 Tax=Coniosporium uncinatum TaxID=93489 RepID=A0ACC3DY40_9PEZI|nr:hypothetical protein LTS18_003262 [Coniosporium uncinatum]